MRVKWHWPLSKPPIKTVVCTAAQSRMNTEMTQLTTYSAQRVNHTFLSQKLIWFKQYEANFQTYFLQTLYICLLFDSTRRVLPTR